MCADAACAGKAWRVGGKEEARGGKARKAVSLSLFASVLEMGELIPIP